MNSQSEFYVGYLPIPRGLKKLVRAVVGGLGVVVAAVAITLVLSQRPFAAATFEFHDYWDFQGVLLIEPYPALAVPGQAPWLLVGPGKHGILPPVADGRIVRFRGVRIYRVDDHMIETIPESRNDAGPGRNPEGVVDLGRVLFSG